MMGRKSYPDAPKPDKKYRVSYIVELHEPIEEHRLIPYRLRSRVLNAIVQYLRETGYEYRRVECKLESIEKM